MTAAKPEFLVLILAIHALVSCTRPPDCFQEDVFCAALVTDVLGLDDHGINQGAWTGLEQSKSTGITDQIAFIESVDARDYEKNIVYFARNGFDVIVTTGAGMQDETLHAADLYPDAVFIGMDQDQKEARPNLIPVTFAEDRMGFLAGALAAHLTKTHVVAGVCETASLDSMWRYCEGFRAGVHYINEQIKVLIEYRDDGSREKLFIDEAWGIETAQRLIRRGADVVFAAGGATGQGALRAAAEEEIPAIGTERDQAEALGEAASSVVTSVFGCAGFEVQNIMRQLRDEVGHEVVIRQFGHTPLDGKIPESLDHPLNALLTGLLSGEISTNVTNKAP